MKIQPEDLLATLPRWWPSFTRRAVAFANHGPRFIPLRFRKVPLWFSCEVGRVYLHLLQAGYGGRCPHGKR